MTNDEQSGPSFVILHSKIRHSVSTIVRPPYWPQLGQITCEGFIVPHFGQACSCFAVRAWCERRMPVRELDCLRFGTAMGTPVDQTGLLASFRESTSVRRGAADSQERQCLVVLEFGAAD